MATRFPEGFLWGAATSSFQIEGAVMEDGRGESIWDRFCRVPGKIANGDTGDVACDHYHRWRDDVENMRDLGLNAYRFSTAWPRIFPAGKGRLNSKGLDFYLTLVDALLTANIEPVITLYHWDLPQALQDKGGWSNRDTAHYFADYAETLYMALGDRVKTWITLNEPKAAVLGGYAFGVHAPGVSDFGQAVQVSHTLLLAHALALRAYRDVSPGKGRIGITLDLYPTYPLTDSAADDEAARLAYEIQCRWFLHPVFLGAYPEEGMAHYRSRGIEPRIERDDLDLLAGNKSDFLGVNYYFPLRVRRFQPRNIGTGGDRDVSAEKHRFLGFEQVVPRDSEKTEMGWEVYPAGLYDILTRISRDYGNPAVMITENGAAFKDDTTSGGQVQDDDRISYLRGHLREALRAISDGVKLEGYFVWSLLDNFEWAHGYSKRFGITRIEFGTQARTWKKSANWYQSTVASNGAALGE
jgi:beta-glucosidase